MGHDCESRKWEERLEEERGGRVLRTLEGHKKLQAAHSQPSID